MPELNFTHISLFESERLPDYLTDGLETTDGKDNKTADASYDLWTKMDIDNIPVIVRSAILKGR